MLSALTPNSNATQLIEEGLILHDVTGHGKGVQDDPGSPAIHHGVRLLLKERPLVRHGDQGGIWISAVHSNTAWLCGNGAENTCVSTRRIE